MFAKKNLVAAAALLALVGAAQAQSSVKLYGSLDVSFGSYKPVDVVNNEPKSTTRVQSGDMMTSFIGFSGVEDLGGGLKAEFALESFIGVDSGSNVPNQAGQFWSRASWVGLSGGFGKVILGQYDNAIFTSGLLYNPFGSSMTFSPTMRHFYDLGSTSSGLNNGVFTNSNYTDTGWVNSITYETPVFAGFSGSLQYSPKESAAAGTSNSYTVSLAYNNGPLSAMVVYLDGGVTPAAAPAYPGEYKAINVGASYDFGVLKAFGQYTNFKYEDTSLLLGAFDKSDVLQVGVSVPVSAAGSILASYGQAKWKLADAFVGDDAKSRIFSLGYDHFISKRTDVYVAFTSEKLTDLKGGRTFAVGVKHAF